MRNKPNILNANVETRTPPAPSPPSLYLSRLPRNDAVSLYFATLRRLSPATRNPAKASIWRNGGRPAAGWLALVLASSSRRNHLLRCYAGKAKKHYPAGCQICISLRLTEDEFRRCRARLPLKESRTLSSFVSPIISELLEILQLVRLSVYQPTRLIYTRIDNRDVSRFVTIAVDCLSRRAVISSAALVRRE